MREMVLSNGVVLLISYRQAVAACVPGKGYQRTDKKWSITTSKHINAWLGSVIKVETVTQKDIDKHLPEGIKL
jgi:hypothetical protein